MFNVCRATNCNGKDEWAAEFVVLGAPKRAEKCECVEALNGTAKLKIKKPTDDGGVPITGYTIEVNLKKKSLILLLLMLILLFIFQET